MTETHEQRDDQDPAPLEHVDAERVSGEEASGTGAPDRAARDVADEIEEDPASNPPEGVRDIKGG